MNSGKARVRRNGIHHTPDEIADLLAREGVRRGHSRILDPACGEGALLAAAARTWRSVHRSASQPLALVGCDKFDQIEPVHELSGLRFLKADFFKYTPSEPFDLIVMNPPYVSAREMARTKRQRYHAKYGAKLGIGKNADLWVYFLLKAMRHLRPGGTIAAVLPWSFLRSFYATSVRKALREQFASIRVLMLTSRCFGSTNQRVLLVWLEGYGEFSKKILFGVSSTAHLPSKFRQLSTDVWDSIGPLDSADGPVSSVLRQLTVNHGFTTLGEHAEIRIGVVTGANDFFVVSPESAREQGFHHSNLVPAITDARHVLGLVVAKKDAGSRLLKLGTCAPPRYNKYIRMGNKLDLHLRSQSARRHPWYSVDVGEPPDGFFPYRVTTAPFLALNGDGVQSTNAIHRVYFNGVEKDEREWIQLSLLSVVGQLSLEAVARVYGNGIMKIEPSGLKSALVHTGIGRVSNTAYDQISKLLSARQSTEAEKLATQHLAEVLQIPSDLIERTTAILEELRRRRVPKSTLSSNR